MRNLTPVLVLMVLIVFSTTIKAQNTVEMLTINQIDDSDFPRLTLFANVQDEFGVPLPDLTATDFDITINDNETTILSVENVRNDNLPISVVLALDTSSSIFGTPLNDTKAAALTFLDSLLPGDEVAILAFNQTPTVVQEFSTDTNELRTAIDGLEANGQTALYDATLAASDLAGSANNSRRFVIFLTDGNEFGGSASAPDDSIELANANNVSFYTIALGFDAQTQYLRRVADETRGQAFTYPSSATLSELYMFLAEYLRTQYVITIDSDIEPDGVDASLSVSANALNDTTSYTPPDLYPQLAVPTAPVAPVSTSTDLTFAVSAERGIEDVTITLNGEPIEISEVPQGVTTYEYTVTLDPYTVDGDAASLLELSASDQEGGQRSASVMVDIASLPPVVSVIGLEQDDTFIGQDLNVALELVRGQRELRSVTYSLNGEEIAMTESPSFEYTIDLFTLPLGTHSLTTVATDGVETTSVVTNFTVVSPAQNTDWSPLVMEIAGTDMALVPAGCFIMGSDGNSDEQPVAETCIEEAFWVDVTPVTNEEFGTAGLFAGDRNPRDRITWFDAAAYCEARGAQLPSEAQWEYVARGPNSFIYPWGDIPSLDRAPNAANSDGGTVAVGAFPESNSWVGASDLAGNVWEWTNSAYLPYPYNASDGREDTTDTTILRVLRGGAATNTIDVLYSANRFAALPDSDFGVIGFRCVTPYNSNPLTDIS